MSSLAGPGFRGKKNVNVHQKWVILFHYFLGTDTAESVSFPPLPVPSHPSEEFNSRQRTQPTCGHWPGRIWVESCPAKPIWILWTIAKPSGMSGPGASGADNLDFGGIFPSLLSCCHGRPCSARCEMSTILSLLREKLCHCRGGEISAILSLSQLPCQTEPRCWANFVCKSPSLLPTFVTNIVAVTIHFLFHRCFQ